MLQEATEKFLKEDTARKYYISGLIVTLEKQSKLRFQIAGITMDRE